MDRISEAVMPVAECKHPRALVSIQLAQAPQYHWWYQHSVNSHPCQNPDPLYQNSRMEFMLVKRVTRQSGGRWWLSGCEHLDS